MRDPRRHRFLFERAAFGLTYLHILLVVFLVASITVASFTSCSADTGNKPLSDEEFLAQVRTSQKSQTDLSPEEGALPPGGEGKELLPIIELATNELDVGLISNKEPTTTELKVYNKGTVPLIIEKVHTTCGCTLGEMRETSIPPGGETTLDITIDPNKIFGFQSRKTLRILSNDPLNRTVQVTVIAEVDPEFSVSSDTIDFGEIRKGTPVEQSVIFRQVGEEPVAITELKPVREPQGLELSYEELPKEEWVSPDKPEYRITARLTEDVPIGLYRAYIMVKTTCTRSSVIQYRIPITGRVLSFYEIAPKALMFRIASAADRGVATVAIQADRPFQIEDLTVNQPDFEVTTRTTDQPNTLCLDLHISPTATNGQKNAQVDFMIKTDDEAIHETVRIYGYVRQT